MCGASISLRVSRGCHAWLVDQSPLNGVEAFDSGQASARVSGLVRDYSPRGLGTESTVDDFGTCRGVVLSRAATILRSIET